MASKSCPQCGAPIDSRSTFCGNCGYSMKANEAATSNPPQGQQRGGYSSPNNEPPPFPIGNMPSSPNYPAGNMPSSPNYQTGGSPSSFTFPANGSMPPPPPYQPDNNAFRPPSGAYPRSESNLPPLQPQLQPQLPQSPQQPRRGKKGMMAILVIAALIIVGGVVLTGVLYATHNPLLAKVGLGSSTSTPSATQAPSANPTQSTTTAPTTTTDTSTSTPSTTPTLTSTSSTTTSVTTQTTSPSSYSATQSGPGCDTNGGTWTPQGISNITCGTRISVSSGNARGYLYLQLPNNAALQRAVLHIFHDALHRISSLKTFQPRPKTMV